MELTDVEVGLIHSWVWDGLERHEDGVTKFEGATIQVEQVTIGEDEDATPVILVRLFWGHASNPLNDQDISGRYVVTMAQHLAMKDNETRARQWRAVGDHLGEQVMNLLQHGEYERL